MFLGWKFDWHGTYIILITSGKTINSNRCLFIIESLSQEFIICYLKGTSFFLRSGNEESTAGSLNKCKCHFHEVNTNSISLLYWYLLNCFVLYEVTLKHWSNIVCLADVISIETLSCIKVIDFNCSIIEHVQMGFENFHIAVIKR